MSKSLIDAFPGIVTAGKRVANQILEQLESDQRVSLQTRELVIPSKDVSQGDLFRLGRTHGDVETPNRLIYGDNLLTMAAVVDQVNGVRRVKEPRLRELHEQACGLRPGFKSFRISWVPRELNAEADQLVRDALASLA